MTYVIELPHTKEDCLNALDEVAGKTTGLLDKTSWGCMSGKHVGWAVVDASSDSDALNFLGGSKLLLDKACVTKVDKITAAQIKAFHKV